MGEGGFSFAERYKQGINIDLNIYSVFYKSYKIIDNHWITIYYINISYLDLLLTEGKTTKNLKNYK
ncbi:hypothetical protein FC758_15070 [Clostridium botulinum]|nr:hypothetical protein [Clostridium botulinum]NFL59903.1 hypothetical protein [Clostridium botulinum]